MCNIGFSWCNIELVNKRYNALTATGSTADIKEPNRKACKRVIGKLQVAPTKYSDAPVKMKILLFITKDNSLVCCII